MRNKSTQKYSLEKMFERQSYKDKLEEFLKNLQEMKKEFDPEVAKDLEAKLGEAMVDIEALRKEVENAKHWLATNPGDNTWIYWVEGCTPAATPAGSVTVVVAASKQGLFQVFCMAN